MFSDPKGRELPFFRVVRVPVRRDGITLPGGREIPCLLMHFPQGECSPSAILAEPAQRLLIPQNHFFHALLGHKKSSPALTCEAGVEERCFTQAEDPGLLFQLS